jgi:hypothetical protein
MRTVVNVFRVAFRRKGPVRVSVLVLRARILNVEQVSGREIEYAPQSLALEDF